MSKLYRMKQDTVGALLRYSVENEPGVTSARLFEYTKEWHGKVWDLKFTWDFERELAKMLSEGYRVTNKQWYPAGHKAEPKRRGPSKEDPRQTRMFG